MGGHSEGELPDSPEQDPERERLREAQTDVSQGGQCTETDG